MTSNPNVHIEETQLAKMPAEQYVEPTAAGERISEQATPADAPTTEPVELDPATPDSPLDQGETITVPPGGARWQPDKQ